MPPSKLPKGSKKPAQKTTIPDIDPNSSFTPESFERELKALASKAKEETWGKWARRQASAYLKTATLLSLVAVYSNVSQWALSPVYGSIPASVWHSKLCMAAVFAGWSGNLFLNRNLPVKPHLLLPVVAIYIPTIQFFLFKISGALTAHWGPLVTEALTLFPITALSIACVANYIEDIELPSSLPRWLTDAAPGMSSYGFLKLAEKISGAVLPGYMGRSVFNTRMGLELVLAASYSLFAPSKLLLYAIPALLHTATLNTHVATPMALASLNTTLNADGWAVLDRQESLTGYISVVESKSDGFRVMRCDHSLLGGEWVRYAGMPRFKNNQVAEPIYGVFVMLEAVRLVELPKPIVDKEGSALVIGLGIGTTPAALVAHGIDTTVVEIDPVVHQFASKYFQLPSNHTPVIDDAVGYTARLANESTTKFDYIVHDVFTGGAEPVELFTLEFLQNLEALLKPNGVIAINYAGDFTLPPPMVVTQTIRRVFPSCRIFRESERDEEALARDKRDFTNMVFFCTKQTDRRITFRKPTPRDLLNSPSRESYMFPRHEVTDDHFLTGAEDGIVTRNDTEKLERWHEKSAIGHWEVMRTVLPDKVWEMW